ncbi:hypothetical protein R3P38DRAFT_2582493 [Favolaschia claudopus]|uniref:Uncharacterized protein n=1 Tax=Favolaschia claudopus TaxID=2862362 RepID=A0AAV9ZA26_9AGAR
MAIHLITYYAENPAASRPPGIVHLMSRQSNAGSDFVFARTGQNISLAKLRAAASNTVTRADRRRANRFRNSSRPDHSTTTSTSTAASSVIDTDEVMPAAPGPSLASYQPSFLGTSPPNPLLPDTAAGLGPSATLADALVYLARRSPSRWMPGLRLHDGTWPTPSTPQGTEPLVDDVLASRFILMIAPTANEGGAGGHETFIEQVLVGFSLWGLFERFVQRGQWIGASYPLERYPFDARTLNIFAASWRNSRENTGNPTGTTFGSEPVDDNSVSSWPDEAIIPWGQLQHGQLRANVHSDYPRVPSRVTIPPAPVTDDTSTTGPTESTVGPTEPLMDVDNEVEPGEVSTNDEHVNPPATDDEKH